MLILMFSILLKVLKVDDCPKSSSVINCRVNFISESFINVVKLGFSRFILQTCFSSLTDNILPISFFTKHKASVKGYPYRTLFNHTALKVKVHFFLSDLICLKHGR